MRSGTAVSDDYAEMMALRFALSYGTGGNEDALALALKEFVWGRAELTTQSDPFGPQ